MNFNNDFNNDFETRCAFCERSISFTPVCCHNSEHQFCDLVCAKLYYDNIEHIKPNMNVYHVAYLRKQLSKHAYEIYEKLNGTIFYMMPNSVGMDVSDKVDARDSYAKVLLKIKH